LGTESDPAPERFHSMPLAQRHWLAASLMASQGKPALEVTEMCAHCGELLELKWDLRSALKASAGLLESAASGRIRVASLELRLPTAEDVDAAADSGDLLRRCLPAAASAIDAELVEQALRDADPLGDVALNAQCCQCGKPIHVTVDLPARWLRTQREVAADLFEEVHTIACRYHWSEREILGLSAARRSFYLGLCRAELETAEWEQHHYA
jgi:hypothetical protein